MHLLRFASLAAILALATACGSPAASTPPPGAVVVELREWQVSLQSTNLPAGSTTFFVKNVGSSAHDLTILKTDLPEGSLPAGDAGQVREDGKVAKTPAISPGVSVQLTASLTPGNYVFLCNEAGHYALGMHVQVTVK